MDNDFLLTQPVKKLLITLGLPMMISMFINSLYNIIDSMFVARLGTDAVTALSIIFPLQNLTVAVSVGLGIGVNSVVARLMGAGDRRGADAAASNALTLSAVHAVLFLLLGLFAMPAYVGLYAAPDTRAYAWSVAYGRIVLTLSAPYLLYLVFEKLFQAIGWMKISMLGMIVGAVVNIALDPVMIFGLFGFPAMGVSGAAVATVIGQSAACVLFVLIYRVRDFPIRLSATNMRLRAPLVKDTYTVALPAALTLALPSVLVGLLNGILIAYSEIYVAVLGLYFKIQTFFYMPANGLVQGMRPLIGYNYGAGQYGRVRETVRWAMIYNGIILFVGFLILEAAPRGVMALFAPEPALLAAGARALKIIAAGFVCSVASIVANGAFEALGRGGDSLIVSLLRQFAIVVPLAWALSRALGPAGVWWAFPAAEALTAVVSLALLRRVLTRLGQKKTAL